MVPFISILDLNLIPFIMKSIEDRLALALAELEITPYSLSKELNYSKPDSIYNILNKKTKIGESFINRLRLSNIPINIEWLMTGFGEPTLIQLLFGGDSKECFCKDSYIYPATLDFELVKRLANLFAKAIGIDMYQVEAKKSLEYGIDFRFIEYFIEDSHAHYSKKYVVSISKDWEVVAFFDFWKSHLGERGQNLLQVRFGKDNVLNSFNKGISEIQKSIFDLNIATETYNDIFPEGPAFVDEKYILLYKTDARL